MTDPATSYPIEEDALLRIRRTSTAMCWIIGAGLVALVAGYLAVWLVPAWRSDMIVRAILGEGIPYSMPAPTLIALFAVGSVPLGGVVYGLWSLHGLFRGYAGGEVFTPDAATRLRRFGAALLFVAGSGVVARTLASVLLTMSNPEGARHMVVTFGSNEFLLIVVAILFLTIGEVLRQATRLSDEISQIV